MKQVTRTRWELLRNPPYSPIVNRLISSEEDEIQALEDITFLNLMAEEEGDCVVERRQCRLEHELVGSRQWSDNMEMQVGRRAREDQVRWEGMDIACTSVNALSLVYPHVPDPRRVFSETLFSNARCSLSV